MPVQGSNRVGHVLDLGAMFRSALAGGTEQYAPTNSWGTGTILTLTPALSSLAVTLDVDEVFDVSSSMLRHLTDQAEAYGVKVAVFPLRRVAVRGLASIRVLKEVDIALERGRYLAMAPNRDAMDVTSDVSQILSARLNALLLDLREYVPTSEYWMLHSPQHNYSVPPSSEYPSPMESFATRSEMMENATIDDLGAWMTALEERGIDAGTGLDRDGLDAEGRIRRLAEASLELPPQVRGPFSDQARAAWLRTFGTAEQFDPGSGVTDFSFAFLGGQTKLRIVAGAPECFAVRTQGEVLLAAPEAVTIGEWARLMLQAHSRDPDAEILVSVPEGSDVLGESSKSLQTAGRLRSVDWEARGPGAEIVIDHADQVQLDLFGASSATVASTGRFSCALTRVAGYIPRCSISGHVVTFDPQGPSEATRWVRGTSGPEGLRVLEGGEGLQVDAPNPFEGRPFPSGDLGAP